MSCFTSFSHSRSRVSMVVDAYGEQHDLPPGDLIGVEVEEEKSPSAPPAPPATARVLRKKAGRVQPLPQKTADNLPQNFALPSARTTTLKAKKGSAGPQPQRSSRAATASGTSMPSPKPPTKPSTPQQTSPESHRAKSGVKLPPIKGARRSPTRNGKGVGRKLTQK